MKKIDSKTIVFITGAYVNHACWDEWRIYFESNGYTTIAPPWPGKDADTATLRRRHPDKKLAAVTMPEIIEHYTKIVKSMPESPIVIGHSFGGLFAQILLNRGLAAAAVAIHAVPPQGVIPYEFNFLKSNLATLGFFTPINETFLMSFKKWQFAFTNGMSLAKQKSSYEELVIPESKRATRGGLTSAAYVDFKKEHAPLLLLAGTRDQCIPAHLCERVYHRYKSNHSIIQFVKKDRNHYILGLPTWREDAEFIRNWIEKIRVPETSSYKVII